MFVMKIGSEYSWPIEFARPMDGGKFDKCTFDAVFKRLTSTQIKKLLEGGKDDDFARGVLVGWKGINDDNGSEIPFSESALDALLDIPSMASVISKAYFESVKGSRTKN